MLKNILAAVGLLVFTACSSVVDLHNDSIVLITTDGSRGTGFYVDDYFIVAAEHVVDDTESITVENENGEAEAFVIYRNEDQDFALLMTPMVGKALPLNCSEPKPGQDVIVVGHSLGWDNLMYREGVVISDDPVINDFYIPFDMTIVGGDSGSPIIRDGKVVGVVSASVVLGPLRHNTNISLMIPGNLVCENLNRGYSGW